MAIAFVIAYTFSTDFFPKYSKELIAHKKIYKTIIAKRDLALQNAINANDINAVSSAIAVSKKELKEYTKEKNKIIANDRYLGYTSFRNFILGTGNRLLSFTLSLFFLFVVVRYVKDNIFQKKYFLITSFVFVVTTGYWLAWSLLSFSLDSKRGFDFPKSWYYIAIYVLPSLIFVAAYYLFKYNNFLEKRLKEAVQILIKFIVLDVKKEFVEKPDEKKYVKSYFNILKKVNEKV